MKTLEQATAVTPLLVTIEQAADMLSIGRTHLYGLINDDTINTVTIGRCRRIAVTELQRYVDAMTTSASANPQPPINSHRRNPT